MTLSDYRRRIGRFILTSNVLLFIVIFLIFWNKGYTSEELGEILKIIIPIKSVYLTAVIKFVIANKKSNEGETEPEIVSNFYKNVSAILIYSHITLITIAVIGYGLFNIIGFKQLTYSIAIIETFFGAYIGLLITDMFKVEKSTFEK